MKHFPYPSISTKDLHFKTIVNENQTFGFGSDGWDLGNGSFNRFIGLLQRNEADIIVSVRNFQNRKSSAQESQR